MGRACLFPISMAKDLCVEARRASHNVSTVLSGLRVRNLHRGSGLRGLQFRAKGFKGPGFRGLNFQGEGFRMLWGFRIFCVRRSQA